MTIRRAVADDADALAHLHVDVWEDAYIGLIPDRILHERRATVPERVDRWRLNLATSPATTTVVEVETGLIGFASIGPDAQARRDSSSDDGRHTAPDSIRVTVVGATSTSAAS